MKTAVFNNKITIIMVSILLFVPLHTHSFSLFTVSNTLMTSIHAFLVGTPLLSWIRMHKHVYTETMALPNATTETSDYIKYLLKKNNCPQDLIENMDIKIGNSFRAQYNINGNHIIVIPTDFEENFKGKLATEAVLRHETAHLEHKDLIRTGIVIVLATILAHYAIEGMAYPIGVVLSPFFPQAFQLIAKIPLAIAKMICITISEIIFMKYKEYAADKKAAQSIQNPEVLKSIATIALQAYENYEKKKKFDPKERGTWKRFITDEILTPDLYHPNYLLRFQLYANAADTLEKVAQTA